jgi:glycosyltransferase involved in cell wall biosynthesis
MNILFVLPGSGRSGGTRVTVELGNHLLRRSHNVQIACRIPPFFSSNGIKRALRKYHFSLLGNNSYDWIQLFKGKVQYYANPEQIKLQNSMIVIAVGSMAVADVLELKGDIFKIRYCHGFSEHEPKLMESAWTVPMSTIAVSERLIQKLEKYSGQKVIGVVPNGINCNEYYNEDLTRDGVGTIFSTNPKKSPEDIIKLMLEINKRWPSMARYVFGVSQCPKELPKNIYYRFPSVTKSRELYNRSKIWLVTSYSEGFCLPILEAMACGCAVISTNHDTAPGLIEHEKNGFLVPIRDIDVFFKYIDLLLNDEETRMSLVKAGEKTLKRFTWENAANNMEKVLESISVK